MIPSENGIILSDINHHLVELSWDIFYGLHANRILGNDAHYRLFNRSNHFPIHLNLFDMMNGENSQYIHKNFKEKITQDKTYYIIETKQHWKRKYKKSLTHIYFGCHENIDSEKYIQCIPSNIHDFFLIPNQTIHTISRNQVVLEISTTPYIYTFKLNIKHDQQLRCQPISIKYQENKYEEQHLPTHDLHIYDVQRLIIDSNESIELIRTTENRFHLCILVEGDGIEIEFNSIDNNQQKQIQQYNYLETFLIPAIINQYRLRPIIKKKKSHQFILLIIFLKWDCKKLTLLDDD
jgi:mannose-6-phosphate isomerase class I